jgi:hypothetical protein
VIYKGVDVREISHSHGGLQYLKYYIKIEKNSKFNISLKQTELFNEKNGLMLRGQWMADYR